MDFTNFNAGSKKEMPTETERRWWDLSDQTRIANSVSSTIAFMMQNQSARFTQAVISARLYGNLSLAGISGVARAKANSSTQTASRERVSFNVVQSVIDTAVAKIGENRPKPYFLTSGGDFKAQRKAKKLNQFVEGLFWEQQAYDKGSDAERDACIWGDGWVKVLAKNERVCFERVMGAELFVDEAEGQYGAPRSMHHVKNVDREELAARIPGKAKVINQANRVSDVELGNQQNVSDMVQVRESWHLPSAPGAKDGKHVITIDGHCLIAPEPWGHDFFPFARWQWSPRPFGFWSQGLAEQLQSIQIEVNKLLYLIQRSYHLGASFKVFVKVGSKVVKEHLNNDIGSIVMYTGDTPPQYVVPPLVPPEIYQHLNALVQRAYEQAGVFQMGATGNKPPGLNSGKALREYKDESSERGKSASRRNEKGFLDLARLAIACARDIAADNGGNYEVSVPGRRFLQKMNWREIDLEESAYIMQCFPVSSLPSDPAGRTQTIQEWVQAGWLSPRQGRKLMDFPDLDRANSLWSADEDVISKMLDGIVDDGEPATPEPSDDLELAKELVLQYLKEGRLNDLDEERMAMLRAFSSQVDMLQQKAAQAQQEAQAAMAANQPGAPQANPTPTPQSDLLPNAPTVQ